MSSICPSQFLNRSHRNVEGVAVVAVAVVVMMVLYSLLYTDQTNSE
jgi:hypothetical protein